MPKYPMNAGNATTYATVNQPLRAVQRKYLWRFVCISTSRRTCQSSLHRKRRPRSTKQRGETKKEGWVQKRLWRAEGFVVLLNLVKAGSTARAVGRLATVHLHALREN
ncbi:MAG: hypothetical protein LQ348_002998 [Seirophora lacunosa]|nr:MAG: hypothetical protein LQ348_002998 [Seirophora lacunosa]